MHELDILIFPAITFRLYLKQSRNAREWYNVYETFVSYAKLRKLTKFFDTNVTQIYETN